MFGSYYLDKFLKLCISETKKMSQFEQFLLVTVNISSYGLVSALNSIVLLQGPLQDLKSSVQGAQWQVPLLFEKKTKDYLLVVQLVVTRCTSHCHLLSLVVIRCHLLQHSLSFNVSLVCLFINDRESRQKGKVREWYLLTLMLLSIIFCIISVKIVVNEVNILLPLSLPGKSEWTILTRQNFWLNDKKWSLI